MPKQKTFESAGGGPVSISVPGKGWIELSGDAVYETDDPAVIEALEGNPDAAIVKAAKKGKEK